MLYPLGAFIQADLARVYGVRHVTLASVQVLVLLLLSIRLFIPEFWNDMALAPDQAPLLLAD